jgi:hypothetical protein
MPDGWVVFLTCLGGLLAILAVVAFVWGWQHRRREVADGEGALPCTSPSAPPPHPSQAVRLNSGRRAVPSVNERLLDPVAALVRSDTLAQKQGGQHLIEADRAYTEPEVATALAVWLQQERTSRRKRWTR